jgi:phosphocarrier protein
MVLGQPRASGRYVIRNELGLHARAAARMIQVARNFAAEVRLLKDGVQVDGKNILDVLSLSCPKGTAVTLVAVGPDAEEALRAIGGLIEQGFGEK